MPPRYYPSNGLYTFDRVYLYRCSMERGQYKFDLYLNDQLPMGDLATWQVLVYDAKDEYVGNLLFPTFPKGVGEIVHKMHIHYNLIVI